MLLVEHLNSSPVTAHDIATWSKKDPKLFKVSQYIRQGWPSVIDDLVLAPFFTRRHELSIFDNCILWGSRVFVPESGREAVIAELHEGTGPYVRLVAWY